MSIGSNSSAAYNIVAFTFDGQDVASQVVKEVKFWSVLQGYDILAEAVVEQDAANGKVHIHTPGRGGVGTAIDVAAGRLLGRISGPADVLAMAVGGALVEGLAGRYLGRPFKREDLDLISAALTPDSSTFLVLVEDYYTQGVITNMSGYNANVVKLAVGDDLSGQLRSYLAGEATHDTGNTEAPMAGLAANGAVG
jgi:uncharacterized membrane protein